MLYQIKKESDSLPRAVYYIIPNELCERFCFYGIGALSNQYLKAGFHLEVHTAKSLTHLFSGLIYICPLIGAALSDSYLGKYKTIVMLSIVYFIGNLLLTLSSINGLIGTYGEYPLWGYLIPVCLIALGSGGIKPCVAAHGGDQFHSGQKHLMDKFFSIFQATINVGIVSALLTTPYLKMLHCFGSECYALAFGIPTIVFGIALMVFVAGKRYYRFVPPEGEFLPWRMMKLISHGFRQWYVASPVERKSKSGWLNFAMPEFSHESVNDTRMMLKIVAMFIPIGFAWMLADQCGTEWQNQYELMNKTFMGLFIPTEASALLRTLMVIILIPFFSYVVFPGLERLGIHPTFAHRIAMGWLVIIIAFVWATSLNYWVNFYASPVYSGNVVVSCEGCLSGLWQLPQMFLHSVGDAMLSPGCILFAYTHVPSMKAIAFSIYLLSIAWGNGLILTLEFPLHYISDTSHRQLIYIILSLLAWITFVLLDKFWFQSSVRPTIQLDMLDSHDTFA